MDTSEYKKIGKDVWIGDLVNIGRPQLVSIGDHVAIDPFFHCTTQLNIGSHVHISSHVSVIGSKEGLLIMKEFTNIATGGRIVCGSDNFKGEGIVSAPGLPDEYKDSLTIEPITFEPFANTGANVIILPGVTLPQGVVIGAGSLVREKDVLEPWTIYAGNPLQKIGDRPREKILAYAEKMGYTY